MTGDAVVGFSWAEGFRHNYRVKKFNWQNDGLSWDYACHVG